MSLSQVTQRLVEIGHDDQYQDIAVWDDKRQTLAILDLSRFQQHVVEAEFEPATIFWRQFAQLGFKLMNWQQGIVLVGYPTHPLWQVTPQLTWQLLRQVLAQCPHLLQQEVDPGRPDAYRLLVRNRLEWEYVMFAHLTSHHVLTSEHYDSELLWTYLFRLGFRFDGVYLGHDSFVTPPPPPPSSTPASQKPLKPSQQLDAMVVELATIQQGMQTVLQQSQEAIRWLEHVIEMK